jgi:hypothetical protein
MAGFIITMIFDPKLAISQTDESIAPNTQTLYEEIAYMDSLLFFAFNTRNLDKLKVLFTEDLEFYHDTAGLGSYEQNMASSERLVRQNNDLRRELVKGSLEVYPIKDYGAIEIGMHTFCHTENGQKDCGTFKFVHIWRKENGS